MDYKLINEYKQQGKTYREIMEILEIPCETHKDYDRFRKKIKYHARKNFKDGTSITASPDYKPTWGTVHYDSDGKIIQEWQRGGIKTNWNEVFLEAMKEHDPIDCIVKFDNLTNTKKSNLLEIPLFDMHFGVADYKYYEGHLRDIIGHIRKGYEHIIITVGSDLLHHNDMQNHTAGLTPIEQLNIRTAYADAFKFYVTLIKEATENAKEVTVIYVKGNHDESPSYWLTDKLSFAFPTVKFDLRFQERKVFTWKNIFIGYIHGNTPINDIDRVFTKEYRKELADMSTVEIHIGHTHKEVVKGNVQDVKGVMLRVLSTGNITDNWHDMNGYVGSYKRFQVFEYSEKHLLSPHYIYGE